MPYEKSLDVESFKEIKEFSDTRITVAVYSYNGGAKKLQVTRETKDPNDEWRFTKLGRMNKDESQGIVPIMMKAVQTM